MNIENPLKNICTILLLLACYHSLVSATEYHVSKTGNDPDIRLLEEGEHGYLQLTFHESYYQYQRDIVTTEILGEAKIPKAIFDLPDGSPVRIDRDYFGTQRTKEINHAGPFSTLDKGKVRLEIW